MTEHVEKRRNRGVLGAAAVAAIIVLVIFAWLMLVKSDEETGRETNSQQSSSQVEGASHESGETDASGDEMQEAGNTNGSEGGVYQDPTGAFTALFPSDPKVTTSLKGSSMTKSSVYQDDKVFLAIDSYRTVGEQEVLADDALKSALLADANAFVGQLGGSELRTTEFADYQGNLSLKYSFEGTGFYGNGVVTMRDLDTYNVVAMYVKNDSTAEASANVFFDSVTFTQ